MSQSEIFRHLSLLIDAIPKPEALQRRLEATPESFDVSDAIDRLLSGENPANIFQQKVAPFLSTADIQASYTLQRSWPFRQNWKKKALVNTLRAAACLTLQSPLQQYEVQRHLPNLGFDPPNIWPRLFAERSTEVTEAIKKLSINLTSSEPDTTFEKIFSLLKGYLKDSDTTAKFEIAYRVGEEATGFTKRFLPAYFKLIFDVFERDKQKFPQLSNQHLNIELYQQLYLNSQGIFLRGANTGLGKMSAFMTHTAVYSNNQYGFIILAPDCFELVQRNKSSGPCEYYVRLQSDVNKMIKDTDEKEFQKRKFKVTITKCPATVRDRHTGETTLTPNDDVTVENTDQNLIQTVLYKTVLG